MFKCKCRTHCPLWRHMGSQNLVNIGSCNGLVHGGTKPLPEPTLSFRRNMSRGIQLMGIWFPQGICRKHLWNIIHTKSLRCRQWPKFVVAKILSVFSVCQRMVKSSMGSNELNLWLSLPAWLWIPRRPNTIHLLGVTLSSVRGRRDGFNYALGGVWWRGMLVSTLAVPTGSDRLANKPPEQAWVRPSGPGRGH